MFCLLFREIVRLLQDISHLFFSFMSGNRAMKDCDGFLAAIRQVLREYGNGNTESAQRNGLRCNVGTGRYSGASDSDDEASDSVQKKL